MLSTFYLDPFYTFSVQGHVLLFYVIMYIWHVLHRYRCLLLICCTFFMCYKLQHNISAYYILYLIYFLPHHLKYPYPYIEYVQEKQSPHLHYISYQVNIMESVHYTHI